jgi:hypothetical protein
MQRDMLYRCDWKQAESITQTPHTGGTDTPAS